MTTIPINSKKVPALIVSNGKKNKERQSWVFPFQFEFVTPTGQKVIHQLKRTKGQFNSATIADKLKQLKDPKNSKWHSTLAKWQEDIAAGRKKKPSRKLRVRFAMVKVRDIVIDDDIQREMDPAWVASIANPNEFETEFMSAIYCMYDTNTGLYISINAQHTLVLETAFAEADLWDDVDPNWNGDPMELEVPVIYVDATSRKLCRKAFKIYNGKKAKRIEPYFNHRLDVFSWRVDEDYTDKIAKQAHEIQLINEKEGFEPISQGDKKHMGMPWAITCVAEMIRHYDRTDRWQFVLGTHKRYWPNLQLDIAEVDLYGFIYDYFKDKFDVYSQDFNEGFLDPCMAIIAKFFTTPHGFASDSTGTQKRFESDKTGKPFDKCSTEDNGSTVYLMKLYKHFGGQHELPAYVNEMNSDRVGDLLKFVDNDLTDLIEAMKEYGNT